ncbi:MAG: hypothetical protein WC846_03785 [Candidatus Gracilibacteria bacterium]|jgi:hypothetical protein
MKQGFLRLPFVKKAVMVAGAATTVSTLMPWYDMRNSVGIGNTYLGVQGPLFVVGMLVLGFGAVSFLNLFLPLAGKSFFNLKRKGGATSMILGAQSLLLLLVANTTFYHPNFGLALSNKTTRFGMMMAFLSAGLMIISGYFARKYEATHGEETEFFVEEEVPSPPASVQSGYAIPERRVQSSLMDTMGEASGAGSGVDPLTLDAKTRYKMMQSQMRYSSSAKTNMWGSGKGSAFGSPEGGDGGMNGMNEPTDY